MLQERFEQNLEQNLKLAWSYDSPEEYFQTYDLDRQFHELLILASGNQTTLRIYRGLNSFVYSTYLFGRQPRSQTVSGILEHQAMYGSIRTGELEQLKTQIRAHVENARGKIRLALKVAER